MKFFIKRKNIILFNSKVKAFSKFSFFFSGYRDSSKKFAQALQIPAEKETSNDEEDDAETRLELANLIMGKGGYFS